MSNATDFGGLNKTMTDNISMIDPIAYYKFNLTQSGNVNFTFSHETVVYSYQLWKFSLLRSDLSEIITINIYGEDLDTFIQNNYLSAGLYYIKIQNYRLDDPASWSGIDYDIKLDFIPNMGNFESEPNNSMVTANPISLNTTVKGNLTENDTVDYFMYTVTEKGNITLLFEHPRRELNYKFWEVSFINSNGVTLFTFDSKGHETALLKQQSVSPGIYYVKINNGYRWYPTNWSGVNYSLTVNFTKTNTGNNTTGNTNNVTNTGNKTTISTKKTVSTKKVTLNKKKATITQGKTVKLKAKVTPSNSNFKKITWYSENPQIATVTKKGVVKGKSVGKTKIWAMTNDYKHAICTITVKAKKEKVTKKKLLGIRTIRNGYKETRFNFKKNGTVEIIYTDTSIPTSYNTHYFSYKINKKSEITFKYKYSNVQYKFTKIKGVKKAVIKANLKNGILIFKNKKNAKKRNGWFYASMFNKVIW